ncbi:MAG: YeeE/YedE family protein [Aestuariivirga sp.]|uniref:DUF6691 family protein n=1 Tax=Aestuariivirga sp. TaxID=2650926 RepID=UPI0025BE7838|nr:DUF6691 family protein [Aestuariivirga sp.]MCA3562001.1 YeeE/YedE family protein [Aestuariivirga sp.]
MDKLTALLAGLLFGAGVTLSGMVNPMKVQNFMDISGKWDPTLIFVMAAALAVTFAGYRLVLRAPRPRFAPAFVIPSLQGIDERLIGGAVVFGLGWGLTGFCPGPALASLVFGYWPSVLFVVAMAVGMLLARYAFLGKNENISSGV